MICRKNFASDSIHLPSVHQNHNKLSTPCQLYKPTKCKFIFVVCSQMLMSCFPRYIPAFWNSPAPASLPRRRRRRRRTPRSWASLPPRNIYFDPAPHTPSPTPSPRSSICRRLSFEMNPSRNRNLPRRRRRPEAFLPFLKSRRPAVSWSSSSV